MPTASLSAFPDGNNSWHEITDRNIATVIGGQSFTLYRYKIDDKIAPHLKQSASNELTFWAGTSSESSIFTATERLIANQVIGSQSSYDDDRSGYYNIGSLSFNAAFGLGAGVSPKAYTLNFTYADNDADKTNDFVGHVRYLLSKMPTVPILTRVPVELLIYTPFPTAAICFIATRLRAATLSL